MYKIVYEKQSTNDAQKLKAAGLDKKAKELIDGIRKNPFQTLPAYEGLVGRLQGYYSRRINIQQRLVYQVFLASFTEAGAEYEGTVKIIRMWTHCDGMR